MANREEIEKVRQEIMRFRELLNIMRDKLQYGERVYEGLFSGFSPDEKKVVKEKDLQWKLAEGMVSDTSRLAQAVIQMQYYSREMERDFDELYNIILTVSEPDEDIPE